MAISQRKNSAARSATPRVDALAKELVALRPDGSRCVRPALDSALFAFFAALLDDYEREPDIARQIALVCEPLLQLRALDPFETAAALQTLFLALDARWRALSQYFVTKFERVLVFVAAEFAFGLLSRRGDSATLWRQARALLALFAYLDPALREDEVSADVARDRLAGWWLAFLHAFPTQLQSVCARSGAALDVQLLLDAAHLYLCLLLSPATPAAVVATAYEELGTLAAFARETCGQPAAAQLAHALLELLQQRLAADERSQPRAAALKTQLLALAGAPAASGEICGLRTRGACACTRFAPPRPLRADQKILNLIGV